MSNYPTLDGLNSIDADSGNLTNITCQTFIATTSAQVPTMLAGDDSTNVANTEFVTDALSTATANLVTTNSSQTITLGSVKTFLTLPQSAATVSNNQDLTTKKYVDDNFINIIGDQVLTTGVKTFSVLPQSSATPTTANQLVPKKYVDDNFVGLTGSQNISGTKSFLSVPKCSVGASANDDIVNKLYIDASVGGLTGTYVGLSGSQNISGTKTFNSLPQSSAVPSVNSDLTNKLYVDNLFSGATGSTGGVFVTLTGDQTISNTKTFNSPPRCAVTASDYRDLVNKEFIDNAVGGLTGTYVGLTGNQTISGTKTFNSLPQSSAVPSVNSDLTNKQYVDSAVSTIGSSYVGLTGNDIIYGLKTFVELPECTQVPSNNADLVNKTYTDTNFLNLVGDQTLTTGVKTFNTLPQSTIAPVLGSEFSNKLYVDNAVAAVAGGTGTFVTLGTSQIITGNKDFNASTTTIRGGLLDVFPATTQLYSYTTNISGATACNISSPATNLSGTTTAISGTNCNISSPATNLSGTTTTISGTNCNITSPATNLSGTITTISAPTCDITSPSTNLSGTTTTISGATACNITSPSTNLSGTTTTISGTTLYLTSPTVVVNDTVNSFYVDASYSNFVGSEFLLNSPYAGVGTPCNLFEVNPVSLVLKSPTISVQDSCTNFGIDATNTYFTGTNTDLTGTNATCFTQISSDSSDKIASTAFVNNHTLANYMTTNTNQSIPTAIKTYGGKQVFNAGTACNTYDATGVTDMTLANNSSVGILNIAADRIRTDTYGVRLALQRYNLQLSEGTFIQPNNAEGFNDYTKPDFAFGVNKNTGYVDIVGVPYSAQASIQMNNLAGIFSWFAGYNQTTTFTISHSIITTYHSGLPSISEAEVYFYFQDFNTGIVRYTTPNLATTTAFTLLPNSTYVRPIITFDLTTAQLPQGDYRIFGYSRVTNAYSLNAGFLSVNFGLAGSPSTETAIQNYNTPIDYTFTSRNLYHCFRNTAMVGVYLINSITASQHITTPIHYSITNFDNMLFQPTISGPVSTPATSTSGSAQGNFDGLRVENADNRYIIYPNYSLILYDNINWATPILVNFKNTTRNPVCVTPTPTQRGSSCRIYFDEIELIKY